MNQSQISNEDFKKLEKPSVDVEGDNNKQKENWREIYLNQIDLLKKYLDLKEEYYSLLSLWIIGTHFHKQFETYPYIFINAMKGSGKTRLLKLIKLLTKDGQMLNSLTEAVLFRTKGTLCIDEFEGITRNGSENLRELLNSAYKKGTGVKRMRKKRTPEGEEQVVEEFDVYRPIAIANIWGMESVLGDRCIPLILEKSSKSDVINLIETFSSDLNVTFILKSQRESDVSDVSLPVGIYTNWNDYIIYKHHTSPTNNITNVTLFDKIYDSKINGRHLELCLPLFVIAGYLGEKILDKTIKTLSGVVQTKKDDEFTENKDVSLIDMISQLPPTDFISIKELTKQFKEFIQSEELWINDRWLGRALKRLNLVKGKKHTNHGAYICPDIKKAAIKIRMFK